MNFKHGDAKVGHVTRLHNIWRGMLKRCDCRDEKSATFVKYAGRGISVCSEWRRYETFKAWATSTGYGDNLTIERIDNNGNYEPSNCKWVAPAEQALNRRTTRNVTIEGVTKPLCSWAKIAGISAPALWHRLRKQGQVRDVLRPVRAPIGSGHYELLF